MKQIFVVFAASAVVISCNDKEYKNDEVNSVDRKGAVETQLSVVKGDSADVLVTKHNVWKNNKLVKEIVTRDTIPALGDTLSVVEDTNGNEQNAKIKKEYEFYITVQ